MPVIMQIIHWAARHRHQVDVRNIRGDDRYRRAPRTPSPQTDSRQKQPNRRVREIIHSPTLYG